MKIAVVSRDYMADDFFEHLTTIVRIADSSACDVIMFSLFSIHRATAFTDLSELLKYTKHVKRLILETGDLYRETDLRTEVWSKGLEYPLLFKRQFAFSSESKLTKRNLIQQLPMRIIDQCCLLICGETNILHLDRKSKSVQDPYLISEVLINLKTKVILSPWHTKCFRYEINEKRKALSSGRLVLSTWNQNSTQGRGGKYPWIAFLNGENRTDMINEVSSPVANRPDIRMGIIDTPL